MKKFNRIALVCLPLLLASCNAPVNSSTADSTVSSTTISTSYPDVTLIVKCPEEVEAGQTITIKANVTGDNNYACTFTSSDTSVATVEANATGTNATITGVKAGKVTITVTSKANPTVSKTAEVTVIAEKAALQTVIKNIQALNNYTLVCGSYDDGAMGTPSSMTFAMEDTIIEIDYDGEPIKRNANGKYLYGETVSSDNKAVYLTEENGQITKTKATLIQSEAGILNKSNFKGLKENTEMPFEVGEFYSLDAFNAEWFTNEKSTNNEYEIDGHALNDEGQPANMGAAFAECMFWNLLAPSSYESAIESLQDEYFFTLASMVETTVTVVSDNSIEVQITDNDNKSYEMIMQDLNATDWETIDIYNDTIHNQVSGTFTASDAVVGSKLMAGVEALKGNNYIQRNQIFPDHKTELVYYTYYTPNYMFVDCTATFVRDYNNHLASDTDPWEDIPYGYAKKSDGVYKFTYDETNNTVTWAEEKEANTDATTDLTVFENYLANIDLIKTDLIYCLGNQETAIWNGKSTKYYECNSYKAYSSILSYYAPDDDEEDAVEKAHAGIGVELDGDKVTAVNLTAGATPYLKDNWDPTDHTYGVNYFTVNEFGNGKNNKVDSLLGL